MIREIERLGGRLHEPRTPPAGLEPLAPPLRQLLFGVQWPEGHAYENDEDRDPWVWGVEFGTRPWTPDAFAAFPCCEGRPFVLLGIADGGNYILAIPLDRESPADPVVHVIDHEETSEDDELDEGSLLSELLSTLRPTPG